jgi:hypothetical protein
MKPDIYPDAPANPWRHIIIPLALQSPPLMLSILAFAAKHMGAIGFSKSEGSGTPDSLSNTLQQHAMRLLAQEVHDFTNSDPSRDVLHVGRDVSRSRSNAILATMLVLCNVETVWPGEL